MGSLGITPTTDLSSYISRNGRLNRGGFSRGWGDRDDGLIAEEVA
nr:MAG TPA: hypothetical protein [Caudoviricetes sp.]